ncbi:hypothetical protein BDQ94DRAFT_42456 [Aspergillus welwitschiae]|uniref:Uncharacterized protein n=1 Tax=Aspergillus welwitschiae TaxID=1341132 RepID=A0A3F3Q1E1_9EURO|nr:hypothetical protein BDQ94DRAFT_42456 [Aspergillus welwitschiae]RDH32486.1 hypothetical protein BDQ94DRAFT_42456 [Aspergillus welwitschiae]
MPCIVTCCHIGRKGGDEPETHGSPTSHRLSLCLSPLTLLLFLWICIHVTSPTRLILFLILIIT